MMAILMLAASSSACTADPGTASGRYQDEDHKIVFNHVLVLRQDDAEKVRDEGPGFRVLLSAEEVDPLALEGALFPPVYNLARENKLHGLLLDFDPAKPGELHIAVLDKTAAEGGGVSTTFSNSDSLWKKLEIADGRMSGELKDRDDMIFRFDAPVHEDPVKEQFRGAAAKSNPLVLMLHRRYEALARGNYAGADAVSSQARRDEIAQASDDLRATARQFAPAMLADVGKIDRLIIRTNIATALSPDGTAHGFVRENGAWKVN
jgi:hypothetical protein